MVAKNHPIYTIAWFILNLELKAHILCPLEGNNKGCKSNTLKVLYQRKLEDSWNIQTEISAFAAILSMIG